MSRIGWTEYFLDLTHFIAKRSTCLRRQIGAVAVRNKRIIATGYNGPPSNIMHCEERGGCLREKLDVTSGKNHSDCYAIHAEENVIIQAAQHGVSLKGSILYCTHQPCSMCVRKIINVGFESLVYINDYPDDMAKALLREAFHSHEYHKEIGDYENVHTWNFEK